MRFADIAVNLTDHMFQGSYHGRKKHDSDLPAIVQRARDTGVDKILITGTSLQESRDALRLAKEFDLHCTAGVHPTSTNEMDAYPEGPEAYLKELRDLIDHDLGPEGSKRIISVGEVGLDYDRLHYSPKETQLRHVADILKLSEKYRLPLFLHARTSESNMDLLRILKEINWSLAWGGGVVHSFTGTMEEMKIWTDMGIYIGINGCSLKTPENLDVVKQIPLSLLLLETDAPWCGPTSSHASFPHLPLADSPLVLEKVSRPDRWKEGKGVKGRMEPCEIGGIATIVAAVRGMEVETLAEAVWENTMTLFWPSKVSEEERQ